MKKLFLIPSIMTIIACGTLGLAVVFSGQGSLTVNETISVSATTMDVTLEPNQTIQKTVTVTNSGNTPADVIVAADVLDDQLGGPYAGVTVTSSQAVTVAGGESADITFTITASNGVTAGTGTVKLDVFRP